MNAPRDFDIGVARHLAQADKQASRINSYAVGPGLADFYGDYGGLPGLRGLWFPGSADNTGAVYDRTGQGRTLTYNGNPLLSLAATPAPPVLLPFYDLDGTGDFLSRADEAGLEISGTETYIATVSRGLTVGGWFKADALSANDGFITKYNITGNQRAYSLQIDSGGTAAAFVVSVDGTATHTATSAAIATGAWMFLVGRFDPSVATEVFVNDVKVSNTTTPPASVFATGTANLEIGRRSAAGTELDGQWALGFLCAARLPDYFLTYLWKRGQVQFGI